MIFCRTINTVLLVNTAVIILAYFTAKTLAEMQKVGPIINRSGYLQNHLQQQYHKPIHGLATFQGKHLIKQSYICLAGPVVQGAAL